MTSCVLTMLYLLWHIQFERPQLLSVPSPTFTPQQSLSPVLDSSKALSDPLVQQATLHHHSPELLSPDQLPAEEQQQQPPPRLGSYSIDQNAHDNLEGQQQQDQESPQDEAGIDSLQQGVRQDPAQHERQQQDAPQSDGGTDGRQQSVDPNPAQQQQQQEELVLSKKGTDEKQQETYLHPLEWRQDQMDTGPSQSEEQPSEGDLQASWHLQKGDASDDSPLSDEGLEGAQHSTPDELETLAVQQAQGDLQQQQASSDKANPDMQRVVSEGNSNPDSIQQQVRRRATSRPVTL